MTKVLLSYSLMLSNKRRSFFMALHYSKKISWLVLGVYYFLTTALHLEVSHFITGPVTTPWGTFMPSEYMDLFGIGCFVLLLGGLCMQILRSKRKAVLLGYWAAWLCQLFLTVKYQLFHPNELLHYPQYAIFAVLLGQCLDPHKDVMPIGRILFYSTVMGMIDEINQYFYLCARHGDYLDFNDMVMNLQGAAAGVLLRYGQCVNEALHKPGLQLYNQLVSLLKSSECKVACITILVPAAFWMSGVLCTRTSYEIPPGAIVRENGNTKIYLERKPHATGSWTASPYKGRCYVFTPVQGIAVMLATGYFWGTFSLWASKKARESDRLC